MSYRNRTLTLEEIDAERIDLYRLEPGQRISLPQGEVTVCIDPSGTRGFMFNGSFFFHHLSEIESYRKIVFSKEELPPSLLEIANQDEEEGEDRMSTILKIVEYMEEHEDYPYHRLDNPSEGGAHMLKDIIKATFIYVDRKVNKKLERIDDKVNQKLGAVGKSEESNRGSSDFTGDEEFTLEVTFSEYDLQVLEELEKEGYDESGIMEHILSMVETKRILNKVTQKQ